VIGMGFVDYIKLGIDTEKKGIKFYTTALRKVDDDNSRKLLLFLIEEEKQHFRMFGDFLTEITKDLPQEKRKTAMSFAKFKLKSPMFDKKAYKAISGKNKQTIDVFNTALYMEKEGMSLYTGMQKKTKDKDVLAFLRKLVHDEQRHYDLIDAHREALHNFIYWDGMEQPRIES
jgi:rubrerythrin